MAFDIKGIVLKVFETKAITEKFQKREIVVEIPDGKFPQQVQFELTGDRCSLADDISEGEEVAISFNLRGREWKSPAGPVKYFVSLDVWKLARIGEKRTAPATSSSGGTDDQIPF